MGQPCGATMKTADLERSKRLKELGFKPEGCFWWLRDPISGEVVIYDNRPSSCEPMSIYYCRAITADEMIEWLLGEGWSVSFFGEVIDISNLAKFKSFKITDGNICNALADAVIWVLEKKA